MLTSQQYNASIQLVYTHLIKKASQWQKLLILEVSRNSRSYEVPLVIPGKQLAMLLTHEPGFLSLFQFPCLQIQIVKLALLSTAPRSCKSWEIRGITYCKVLEVLYFVFFPIARSTDTIYRKHGLVISSSPLEGSFVSGKFVRRPLRLGSYIKENL